MYDFKAIQEIFWAVLSVVGGALALYVLQAVATLEPGQDIVWAVLATGAARFVAAALIVVFGPKLKGLIGQG